MVSDGRALRVLGTREVNTSPKSRRRMSASPRTSETSDRFIPARSSRSTELAAFSIEKAASSGEGAPEVNASPAKEEYKRLLARNLFSGEACNNRVLSFGCQSARAASGAASCSREDSLRMLFTRNRTEVAKGASWWTGRPIPQSPERILDAPDLLGAKAPTATQLCPALAAFLSLLVCAAFLLQSHPQLAPCSGRAQTTTT